MMKLNQNELGLKLKTVNVHFKLGTKNGCFDISHDWEKSVNDEGQEISNLAEGELVLLIDENIVCDAKVEFINDIPYARPISRTRPFQKG